MKKPFGDEIMIANYIQKRKKILFLPTPPEKRQNFLLPFPADGNIIEAIISSEVLSMASRTLTTVSFFFGAYARFMGMGYFAVEK